MKYNIALYLGAEPHAGGVFQYNQALLLAVHQLYQENYDVTVIYSSASWQPYLNYNQVKGFYVPVSFAVRFLTKMLRKISVVLWRWTTPYWHPLARFLKSKKIDLCIYPSEDYASYEIPTQALVAVHDLMHRYEKSFPEVSANGEFERRDRLYFSICKWAGGILVDSAVGKKQVQESYNVDETKIHILPYVPSGHIYQPQKNDQFDKRYLLPQKFIFYPAQFWDHKNHKRLIRVISKLKPQISNIKLVLAGAKNKGYKSIIRIVEELNLSDTVLFMGFVPDQEIPEFYKRARALVMPTFFGPTNIPPLEAFVLGCPVAISNIYGMPEQVGDAALLFDPLSEDSIAEVIKKLWIDDVLCEKLRSRGLEKSRLWDQEHFNSRLIEIVQNEIHKFNSKKAVETCSFGEKY